MSYGVLTTKSGQLQVEARAGVRPGSASAASLDRFGERTGRTWASGRVSVTRLHVAFLPGAGARTATPVNLDVADVESVQITGGRVSRVITLVTPGHLLRFKTAGAGAQAFAQAIATAAEAARSGARPPRRAG